MLPTLHLLPICINFPASVPSLLLKIFSPLINNYENLTDHLRSSIVPPLMHTGFSLHQTSVVVITYITL